MMISKKVITYTPFASCIHNTVTQDQTTISTYEIATSKFFNDVWSRVPTFRTNQANGKVWSKYMSSLLLLLLPLGSQLMTLPGLGL